MFEETLFKVPSTGRSALTNDPAPPAWQVLDLADRGRPDDLNDMEEFLDTFEKSDWWQDYMQKYFGMVACLDENVGKLLNSIKGNGIEKNTILVFTSDHGYVRRILFRSFYHDKLTFQNLTNESVMFLLAAINFMLLLGTC